MAEKPPTIEDRHERDRLWWRHECDRLQEELAKAEARAERLAGVVAWARVQLRIFARHEGTDDLSRRCGLAAEEVEKQTALADTAPPQPVSPADKLPGERTDGELSYTRPADGNDTNTAFLKIDPADLERMRNANLRVLDAEEQAVMTQALRRGVRTVAQAATPTCEHSNRMGVCAVWCPDCGSVLRYAPEGWVPPRERCESIDGELAVGDTCTSTDSRRCDALEARLDKANRRIRELQDQCERTWQQERAD
jgi:hypothetical protein